MREISPINRSTNQARKYYDRISKFYDWLTSGEKKFVKLGVDLLSVKPKEKIVEVGCGTGAGIKYIQRKLSLEGILVGFDLSHQMLKRSQTKIEFNNSGTHLVQGDAAKLPIKQDQFDGVFCSFTLELFSEREIRHVFTEFCRILNPGGRLAIVSLAQEPHTVAVDIYEWFHKKFPVAVDCRPIPLLYLLVDAGFEVTESRTDHYWGLPITIAYATLNEIIQIPTFQEKTSNIKLINMFIKEIPIILI